METASGGTGFPNPSPLVDDAAWMVAIEADDADPIGDIAHLEHLLQSSSVAEGAMLFQTLHRLREALRNSPSDSIEVGKPHKHPLVNVVARCVVDGHVVRHGDAPL